jgi:hypothetical protein
MGGRETWIEAARQASDTGTVDVVCPENADGPLQLAWIPASAGDQNEGEYRLFCPACGAENFVLLRDRRAL